jgi:hypothetical protein
MTNGRAGSGKARDAIVRPQQPPRLALFPPPVKLKTHPPAIGLTPALALVRMEEFLKEHDVGVNLSEAAPDGIFHSHVAQFAIVPPATRPA